MFKTQNFCHIASNNRNQVKVGVFVYRTTDSLETVSASGYFNERIIDLKLHDIIIHEQIDASDATKVKQNFLCVVERTLTNVKVKIMDTDELDGADTDLSNLTTAGKANISALGTYDSNATYASGTVGAALKGKLNLDGSNIMTGPLKMRASASFQCAIAPYWDGVGFYKLNDNDSVTLMASMEDTTGFIPAGTATYNLGSSDHKWKDLYVARVITGVLNNGANITVPTVGGTLARVEDIENKITNCITEIPQDINVSYSNNILVIKSGTKLYRPNGADIFDEITLTTDETFTVSGTGTFYVFRGEANGISYVSASLADINSGTPDSSTNGVFYDTTNNRIDYYTSGTRSDRLYAFPICKITVSSGNIKNIDQVFNGFGYVGSKVYVLPGVKGLAPNGRNADGTLNNTVVNITSVKTADSYNDYYMLNNAGTFPASYYNYFEQNERPRISDGSWYQPSTNTMYAINNSVLTRLTNTLYAFKIFAGTSISKATAIKINQPVHTVDYCDTEFISNQAMPSDYYIDLTLGASGTAYTAPADGYVCIHPVFSSGSGWCGITITTSTGGELYGAMTQYTSAQTYQPISIYVSKNTTFTIIYNNVGSWNYTRFVYANGAK